MHLTLGAERMDLLMAALRLSPAELALHRKAVIDFPPGYKGEVRYAPATSD